MQRPSTAPPSSSTSNQDQSSFALPLSPPHLDEDSSGLQGLERHLWPASVEDLFLQSTDWQLINGTLQVLRDQLQTCTQDVELIKLLRERAVIDPDCFIQKDNLQTLPSHQQVQKLPWVNPFNLYSSMRSSRRLASASRHQVNQDILMRRLDQLQAQDSFLVLTSANSLSPLSSSQPVSANREAGRLVKSASVNNLSSPTLTRRSTRAMSMSPLNKPSPVSTPMSTTYVKVKRKRLGSPKSATHNVTWTEAEKQRLQELLLVYPEELVPARRWAKIAAALGTRTANQVASRVAKQKLRRERIISSAVDSDESGEEALNMSHPQYAEYMALKQALDRFKQGEPVKVHAGYRCDHCFQEPILGDRWSCMTCHQYDACTKCHAKPRGKRTHDVTHEVLRF